MFGMSDLSVSLPQYILVGIFVLTIAYWLSCRKNLPPGPWGIIPYIGYAPNIVYAIYRGIELHKYLLDIGRPYGKMYSFTAFGIPVIVMNDLKLIREAFQTMTLNDRGDNEIQALLFSRSFNKLRDMEPYRRFALSTFRKFGIGTSGFEKPISKESTELLEELAKVQDEPVELTWYINNAISNIIFQVVFGTRFQFTDERIQRLTSLLNRQNELAGAGGLEIFVPINIPSEAKRGMNKVATELLQFIEGMIEEHRKNFDPEQLNDMTDMWLNEIRLHESKDPDSFLNPKNMHGQVLLLFLGGTDTTSNTIRWGIQYLIKHPDVQARIQRELDTQTERNRLPKLADKSSLPYMEAFISELHRVIAIFPLSGFHVASESTSFQGYSIPKNSIVISNLYAVMNDPKVWNDPEIFRPERFLNENGEVYRRDEMVAFGVGRRNCIGEALAKQQLFIFFSHLLHQFTFQTPYEGAPLPSLKPVAGVVTHPEPYKLRVTKRD